MKLRYLYEQHNGSKQLMGCVVQLDDGRLGYSAVHPKDRRKMSQKLARTIAIGRAEKCSISGWAQGAWCARGDSWRRVPAVVVPALAELAEVK